ncbi:MAG: acetyl-CoA carboxylase biotin carboxyl carrier protein [Candidatus Eremiobacteraeota bacterium]|nr:acetyl-CoA carboxylase biotin carboxyl carrier protein [Candidatus Eremiobacteraeota bacterium]MBC5804092.1 acetyl-CoA carboxylase biotin carboxyl carrier protein [Candidatus Eremiobacteraeota bacterium]MBC5821996.1 acetyl-CoA carboxylase biotin carboxyl carrier protein [Candidatus Eremiobacteraeota bacterium]
MLSILRDNDLDGLTVRHGEATYELLARPEPGASVAPPTAAAVAPAGVAAVGSGAPLGSVAATSAVDYKRVTAPIIGVFYRAPSPGVEPFVEVGGRVEVGQPLCILEAMKLMNEITSDYAGVVRRILPENGALVSLGEEMFWIEP